MYSQHPYNTGAYTMVVYIMVKPKNHIKILTKKWKGTKKPMSLTQKLDGNLEVLILLLKASLLLRST